MKIVIALGGNALGLLPSVQLENAKMTSSLLKDIILDQNNQVVITHGNGPQVGLINLAFEEGAKNNKNVCLMPFTECNALSQSYIGYHLANSLYNELNGKKKVVNITTQVLVDKNDKAFSNPTKPVGSFYQYDEIKDLPYTFKEDSGRGYRRVVASPLPKSIIEIDQIKTNIEAQYTVITCGGGGIPVINDNGLLKGIDAVIDKDFASSLLAREIDADILMILTAVPNAKINFNTKNEKDLGKISLAEIKKHYENGEFKEGSMKPKVKACIDFLEGKKNKIAIISDLKSAKDAIKLEKGTIIYSED